MMTTPADAIKSEIRESIDIQIQVFGQASPLKPLELRDCPRRAERIKRPWEELDEFGIATVLREHFGKPS